jgi:hypothetical protein
MKPGRKGGRGVYSVRKMVPPPSWRPSAKTWEIHEYFTERVVETAHTLTEAAAEACDVNPDLSPGLDCCAVCAAVLPRAAVGKNTQKANRPPLQQQGLLPCSSCQKGGSRHDTEKWGFVCYVSARTAVRHACRPCVGLQIKYINIYIILIHINIINIIIILIFRII